MANEDELREVWRKRWLDSINELTSLQLQQQTWLNPKLSSPHWSFVEFMCCYFDDLFHGNSYQDFVKLGYVSNQEYRIIEQWHKALDNYFPPDKDGYVAEAILIDPKWLTVIGLGIEAKAVLLPLLNSIEAGYLLDAVNPFE